MRLTWKGARTCAWAVFNFFAAKTHLVCFCFSPCWQNRAAIDYGCPWLGSPFGLLLGSALGQERRGDGNFTPRYFSRRPENIRLGWKYASSAQRIFQLSLLHRTRAIILLCCSGRAGLAPSSSRAAFASCQFRYRHTSRVHSPARCLSVRLRRKQALLQDGLLQQPVNVGCQTSDRKATPEVALTTVRFKARRASRHVSK